TYGSVAAVSRSPAHQVSPAADRACRRDWHSGQPSRGPATASNCSPGRLPGLKSAGSGAGGQFIFPLIGLPLKPAVGAPGPVAWTFLSVRMQGRTGRSVLDGVGSLLPLA